MQDTNYFTDIKKETYEYNRITTRNIELWVKYNEQLEEYSNALRVSNDPYLPTVCIADINVGVGDIHRIDVELTLKRILQNFEDYMRRKMQGDGDEQKTKSIAKKDNQYELEIQELVI